MKTTDIKSAISKTLGINELNAMQTAVAVADARRLLLLSPTGSGKTIAFTIAVLRRMSANDVSNSDVDTVVIAPSRELVRQIYGVVRPVAAVFGLKTLAMYGGNSFSSEESSIQGSVPNIIIATPGRLLDHINRSTIDISHVKNVVLDEYDKTLELGFHDEMQKVMRRIKSPSFVMVTSATRLTEMPSFVDLKGVETIDFTPVSTVENRLRIVNVPSHEADKLATLGALVRNISSKGPCIVFVNHRESAERVGQYLKKEKISAVVYHGGLDQQQREMALARFDSHAAPVLVATDLAGRGIDIEGVASVIHYHPANDAETWKHRNGRTARVDRSGEVYVITGPNDDVADFVKYDNDFYPDMTASGPVRSDMGLIYFDKGKRDKISRGDIAGFVMKKAEVPADAVGKITLGNAYSLVAVRHEYVGHVIDVARTEKIKNVRVRASLLK